MAAILGGEGAETLVGDTADDLLVGFGGADSLAGGEGADTLEAGSGADRLDGGPGQDRAVIDRTSSSAALRVFLLGPGFTSTIDGAEARGIEAFTLLAGAGADSLVGAAGDDLLAGGGGGDALTGGAGADTLQGGEEADTLLGGAGADLLAGGPGGDRFALQDAAAAVAGSTLAAMDTIRGFDPATGDLIWLRGQSAAGGLLPLDGPGRFGLAGQATLPVGFAGSLPALAAPEAGLVLPDATGGAAIQLYWAPAVAEAAGWLLLDLDRDGVLGPTDLVVRVEFAAPGATIDASGFAPGSFARLGTTAADRIVAGGGPETIHGFAGGDSLDGGAVSDSLTGGDGGDSLLGGAGFDTLRGGTGADTLGGETEADVLDGGDGTDRLAGAAGADLLLGGAGLDLIEGGEGDDTLEAAGRGDGAVLLGPAGGDTLLGGAGADLFVLQGGGDPSWSRPEAPVVVADFGRFGGDRLRFGTAGAVADAGTLLGADGRARPLVWSAGPSDPVAAPAIGLRLPGQYLPGLDAIQIFWLRDPAAGGWLALDLDGNGVLGAGDSLTRIDGVDALTPADFLPGSLTGFAGGAAASGTAGDDDLRGTARSELFFGTAGRDTIDGGAGAPNAISYAGLGSGGIAFSVLADAIGYGLVAKPGLAIDLMRLIQGVTGTAAGDTLDGSRAPAEAIYALSLEGLAGDDSITGNGARSVQASYAASPAAVRVDLVAGTASDGWGGTDSLVGIRRVALLSAHDDTALGSMADEIFLSGADGFKRIEGGGGLDEYRYAGSGAVSVMLAEEVVGLFRLPPRADKPGGRDTLTGIAVAVGGAGDDTLRGGAAAERFAGGPGADSIDGADGIDLVFYDVLSTSAGLAQHGVVLDLGAGTATDPWDGQDLLANIENAWGSQLADDMTGRAVAGIATFLRGLGGDDTLRAPVGGTLVTADYAADPGGIFADLAAGQVADGWGGRDRLYGIVALRGTDFADSVLGTSAADRIEGGAGADSLDGGPGADTLAGGAGDDLYVVDSALDRVVELPGGGDDSIRAAVSLILPDGIEVALIAPGAIGIEVQGQGLDNEIRGEARADRILGWGGQDTIAGGAENDTLLGNAGLDSLAGEAGTDRLLGGPGDDTILGGDGRDTIYGEDGADLLLGEAEQDFVVCGLGADTADGGPGADSIWGQAGDDSLAGGADPDWLLGGDGADTQDGGDGNDIVYGENDNDRLIGGLGTDFLYGNYGDDTLDGGVDPDSLRGDLGNDSLNAGPGNDFAFGGLGNDMLAGEDGIDTLWGEDGNDVLVGGLGNDWLLGGPGDDSLVGEAGIDNLIGHDGRDTLDGGADSDWIRAGADDDLLLGGAGIDNLWGEAGNDSLDGGPLLDLMNGGMGDDLYRVDDRRDLLFEQAGWGIDTVIASVPFNLAPFVDHLILLDAAGDAEANGNLVANAMAGNAGANRLVGWGGDDTLSGWAGADTLLGADGQDSLAGGEGLDSLVGGVGADTLEGGPGADTLRGDAGADVFRIGAGSGADRIQGFEPGIDRIRLTAFTAEDLPALLAAAVQIGGATLLDLGQGDSLTLEAFARGRLGAGDVLFG